MSRFRIPYSKSAPKIPISFYKENKYIKSSTKAVQSISLENRGDLRYSMKNMAMFLPNAKLLR